MLYAIQETQPNCSLTVQDNGIMAHLPLPVNADTFRLNLSRMLNDPLRNELEFSGVTLIRGRSDVTVATKAGNFSLPWAWLWKLAQ